MDRYRIESKLGSGAFGSVFKAVHRDSGTPVAVKRLCERFACWDDCLALREVRALCALRHPSLIQLLAVVRERTGRLYLIFELAGGSVYEAIRDRGRPVPEPKIRAWLRQALQGLAYIHAAGHVHRDIKPENLLLARRGAALKIADFGLARPAGGDPWDDQGRPWTEYASTRWYRAPEILLRAPTYGPPVDLFALGAVAAELYTLRPLFPGSSETDQLTCIAAVLGPPSEEIWPEGRRLAAALGFQFPVGPGAGPRWAEALPEVSPEARDLIAALCTWDPAKRLTAEQALAHPYFLSAGDGAGAGVLRPLATPQAAAAAEGLLAAAQRVARGEGAGGGAALARLARRAAKRQRATLRQRRRRHPGELEPCI